MSKRLVDLHLAINGAILRKHDYRQDTAFDGRRLVRLPDRTLVYADEYEERLREYEERQQAASEGASSP